MSDAAGVIIELVRPDDIAGARSALRRLLRQHWGVDSGDAVAIDALLAASEIMSNALEHTAGPCTATLQVDDERSTLRVAVHDGDPAGPRPVTMPDAHHHHGRGLAIVALVASRWGTVLDHDGKTVWFEIDRAG